MYFLQKFDTFIRIYDNIGYILNNQNSSDSVVSPSGAIFLSVLSREPQIFNELLEKIKEKFTSIDLETIKNDVLEFYNMLEVDGFIVSGETPHECELKDTRFSYRSLDPEFLKYDFPPQMKRTEKSTQEFLSQHFRNKPTLKSLQIEISNRCNERCVHCYIPHENKTQDIESELFDSVLEQSQKMGTLDLTLSGGEPMIHKRFSDFLIKCNKYDFSVGILSNLTLLNDEIISAMKATRLSGVQVSLYSLDPAVHDEITQTKGSFEKTKNAILTLIENDIPVRIACPIMKQNKDCYLNVINWAKEHKIRATIDYGLRARYDHTTQNLDNRLSSNEIKKVINNTIENDSAYQNKTRDIETVQDRRRILSDYVCEVGTSSLSIAANGNVYPCSGWQGYVTGDLKKQSLQDIWDNNDRLQYLRQVRMKDFPKCLECEDKAFCVICMVQNFNETKDPLVVSEHFCKAAKIKRKIVLDRTKNLKNA